MKLEDQVCSLRLAMKLKELGVEQDSYFYYVSGYSKDLWSIVPMILFDKPIDIENSDYFSAFTVAELGEMLPFKYKMHLNCLSCLKSSFGWEINYGINEMFSDENEANARAKMLIHIKEHQD